MSGRSTPDRFAGLSNAELRQIFLREQDTLTQSEVDALSRAMFAASKKEMTPLEPGARCQLSQAKRVHNYAGIVVASSCPYRPEDRVSTVDARGEERVLEVRGLNTSHGGAPVYYQVADPNDDALSWFLVRRDGVTSWKQAVPVEIPDVPASGWSATPQEPMSVFVPPARPIDVALRVRPGHVATPEQ